MNIAIVGAGIYGCHLALSLKSDKMNIDLYEMSDDIFNGASRYNSFRIHKGYHYPRSGRTRDMCKRDEAEFVRHYAHLISTEEANPKIFCIADDRRTLLDLITMRIIFQGAGLPFEELSQDDLHQLGFRNVEGGFKVHEAVLLVDEAKSWFKESLLAAGINLELGVAVEAIDRIDDKKIAISSRIYDFIINCTYNQALIYASDRYEHYYDLCLSLLVAHRGDKSCVPSFGVFDGKFPSLEPFGYNEVPEKYRHQATGRLFQLFHVEHTSIEKYRDIGEARQALDAGVAAGRLAMIKERMVTDVMNFYPEFLEEFEVIDHVLALKTKVTDNSDARPLLVRRDVARHSRLIQVFSSKLTSVFSAERAVRSILAEETGSSSIRPAPPRSDSDRFL